jgi:hypothetical protein
MVDLDSIRIIAHRAQIREENIYFLLTLLFPLYPILTSRSDQCHVSMVISSTTANVATIAPSPARLGSTITSMNQQRQHATANVASASPSLAGLDNDITHGQRRLGNAISRKTR